MTGLQGAFLKPLRYLDTARLGPTTPSAQWAQFDFVRLAAEEPSSLYFERFLREGFAAWPRAYQHRFPGLATWNGVRGLKQSLRMLAGVPSDWRVLLASRSLPLVRLGATAMFRVCRNVFTTDLSWPTYQRAVLKRAQQVGCQISMVALRDHILQDKWTEAAVVAYLTRVFVEKQCDGIFLPAVDHLGIRLPLGKIICAISAVTNLAFVLVDAAQALCQVPLADFMHLSDFVVAGCHKWLGAYLPLGVAFYGRSQSRAWTERRLQRAMAQGRGDPLTAFTEQFSDGRTGRSGETVNLASLFSATGAAVDQQQIESGGDLNSASLLSETTLPTRYWKPVLAARSLQSRIALVQCESPAGRKMSADEVRRTWLRAGAVVTGYDGGLARLSFGQQIAPHAGKPEIAIFRHRPRVPLVVRRQIRRHRV